MEFINEIIKTKKMKQEKTNQNDANAPIPLNTEIAKLSKVIKRNTINQTVLIINVIILSIVMGLLVFRVNRVQGEIKHNSTYKSTNNHKFLFL